MRSCKSILFFLAGLILFIYPGCKDDKNDIPEPAIPNQAIIFKINHNIDGAALLFDSMIFQNVAGNAYSINKLQYYLSGFSFSDSTGNYVSSDTVIYIEAIQGLSNNFNIKGLNFGNYTTLSLFIGLDSLQNITGYLPNTLTNLNMAWPDIMGGGYHFMKFEGNFLNQGTSYGYAMHLGKNQNLVTINLQRTFTIQSNSDTITLDMNINEWFKNPEVYDFNIDGNYSMGSNDAMLKLSINGRDVFN